MEWQTKQIRRTYNRLGLGMLAYLLIYQFLSLPLMLLVKLLCPQLLSSSWFGLLLGELVQYAIALPVCWWIAKSANTPQRPLSRRKLSVSCFFKYLLLSIGLLFLFNLIGTAVNELLSQLKGSPAGNLVEQSVGSYTLWQMVLVTVISAPLGEELLFRKLVYRCVGAYGDKAYVFTSACLFMLMATWYSIRMRLRWADCLHGSTARQAPCGTPFCCMPVSILSEGSSRIWQERVNWCCRCWECSICWEQLTSATLSGGAEEGIRCKTTRSCRRVRWMLLCSMWGCCCLQLPPLRWQAM